jgi:hypothetical protein
LKTNEKRLRGIIENKTNKQYPSRNLYQEKWSVGLLMLSLHRKDHLARGGGCKLEHAYDQGAGYRKNVPWSSALYGSSFIW